MRDVDEKTREYKYGKRIKHGTKVDLTELWHKKINEEQERIASSGMVSIDPILRSNPKT